MSGAFYGLLTIGLVLMPGIAYRVGREWGLPPKRTRGFRETALLIFPGYAAILAGLAIFGLYRWRFPSSTPDLGKLFWGEHRDEYTRSELPELFGWGTSIVFLSCLIAFLAGLAVGRYSRRFESTWEEYLDRTPSTQAYVKCYLVSGSMVTGYVQSLNRDLEETGDRDICLFTPRYYSEYLEEEPEEYNASDHPWEESVAVISAEKINFIVSTRYSKYGIAIGERGWLPAIRLGSKK